MRQRISDRRIALSLSALLGPIATAVACGSSEPREQFEAKDGGSDAALPDSSGGDGGAPIDAAKQKPPFDPNGEPVTCTSTPCAVEIVAGEGHFCARMSDGTVRCWGDNTKGSLGLDDAGVPTDVADAGSLDAGGWAAPRVTDLTDAKQLSAGGATTCALLGDGGVVCWGGNDKGQLGLDANAVIADTERHPVPAHVALSSAATRVDVGQQSVCAILQGGDVWCWGDNSQQQLARTPAAEAAVPGKAELGDRDIARTAAGTFTGFAVSTTGELVSWGAVGGVEGSAAARSSSISPDPLPLPIEIDSVTSFSVSSTRTYTPAYPLFPRGIAHACAISKGEVFCWGDSLMGAIGAGVPERVQRPRHAALSSDTAWAQQVAAAGDFTCVRLTDGTVECTGDNAFGVLGKDPEKLFSMLFEPAALGDAHVVQIAAASSSVCALVQGGSVICWGKNDRGELGQGHSDGDPHPTPVPVRF